MGTNIFLGKPPANIEQWIKDHHGPVVKATTAVKYIASSSIQYWEGDIVGELTDSSIPDMSIIAEVEIGSHVTSIGDYAFSGCSYLTSVTIPDSVTSIGREAFRDCNGLTSITIPDSVTSIDAAAFYRCSGLTSVAISDGVKNIGQSAFQSCTGITSVAIPASVTSIGNGAFDACRRLTSVTFDGFTKDKVKSMTTNDHIFGYSFYDDELNPMEKSFTAICTNGSMTVHFSATLPATITFTDL